MVALHQRQHTRTPHTEEQTSQANGKLDSKESNALHRRISLPYDHVFKCTYQKKKKIISICHFSRLGILFPVAHKH